MAETDGRGDDGGGSDAPSRVSWPPIILASAIVLALVLGALLPLPAFPGVVGDAARVLGLVLVAAAIAIDLWALATLARARTTVLPHRTASALVTSGPFARSRNPIYVANAILLLGLGFALGNLWFLPLAAVLVVLTNAVAAVPEERHLARRFGEDFEAYRRRVPRWF